MNRTLLSTGLAALAGLAGAAAVGQTSSSFEGDVKDAWLTGRIETMYLLNEHLSPFSIDTEVEDGIVTLTGTVESEIDRDLAGALARNLDGVVEVENELAVDADVVQPAEPEANDEDSGRDFGTWFDDATTTAAVKSRLIANEHTKGLQIDVDTNEDVVTLSGSVESEQEKDLAEEIAFHTKDVVEVRNNLVVDPS